MYGADARDRWRAAPLADRRVQHWWDERRVLGTYLLDKLRVHQSLRAPGSKVFSGPVLWDAYLLFDRGAHWGATIPTPVSWGYTILAARDSLSTQVREQLRRPKVP